MEMTYAVQEFDFCLTEEEMSRFSEMNPKAEMLIKRNVHRAINNLTPHMKESLLDCLRTKITMFSISGEEFPTKSWFIRYLEMLLGWSNLSRRHLANVPQLTIDSDPDPLPEDSGIFDPPPSNTEPGTDNTPTLSDSSGTDYTPTFSDSSSPPSPAKSSPSIRPSPETRVEKSKQEPPPKEPEDSSNQTAALAAAAVVVLALAILLILFYLKLRSNQIVPTDGQRDEKPLLALSDFSAGMASKYDSFAKKNFKFYFVLNWYFYLQSLRFFT